MAATLKTPGLGRGVSRGAGPPRFSAEEVGAARPAPCGGAGSSARRLPHGAAEVGRGGGGVDGGSWLGPVLSPCAGAGGRAATPPIAPGPQERPGHCEVESLRQEAMLERGRRCPSGSHVTEVQGCNNATTKSQEQICGRSEKFWMCTAGIIISVLLVLGLCGIPWLRGTPQQNTTTSVPFSSPSLVSPKANSTAETVVFSSTALSYSACHNFCHDRGWELLEPGVAWVQQEHYRTTWVQTPSTKDQPWICFYLEDGEQRQSSCTVTRPCHCMETSATASQQN